MTNDLTMVPDRWRVRTLSEKRALAEELVGIALEARYPRKSLASLLREASHHGVREPLVEEVGPVAREILEVKLRSAEAGSHGARWLTPSQAAVALGQTLRWVQDALDSPAGRRALGYPWFAGRRWKIPQEACDPATRASYLSALPDSEPEANLALLPNREKPGEQP